MPAGPERIETPNPYQPLSGGGEPGPPNSLTSFYPAIAAILVAVLAISSVCCGLAAYRLRKDFPGLYDHSPHVDGYWPAVARFIYMSVAAVSGLLALIIAILGGYRSRPRRAERRLGQAPLDIEGNAWPEEKEADS